MAREDIIKQVSEILFEKFFVDGSKYGRQQEDGSYRLVRERVTPVTIDDMILNQKSLLTYQETHSLKNAFLKWVCIDLDIVKKVNDADKENSENVAIVKKAADQVCSFLDSVKISYLLEFSGRRGFHIWIVFEELLSKEIGFKLVSHILSKVVLPDILAADKFPKVSFVNKNSKGVGSGVKLPLSKHSVSKKIAHFVQANEAFEADNTKWPDYSDADFLTKQLEILKGHRKVGYELIEPIILEYDAENKSYFNFRRYASNKKVETDSLESQSLDSILESLRGCHHMNDILKDYQNALGGKERSILVGLLARLQTKENPNYGNDLLLELFSNIKGFNKEITEKKLALSQSFHPINCSHFGKCSACHEKDISSPIELIKGVNLTDRPPFKISNIDKKFFDKLVRAQYKYSIINDEVPLYPQLVKLEYTDLEKLRDMVELIFKDQAIPMTEIYKFERNEITKIRHLYNIDQYNNLVSTYFLFILNNIFYSNISSNSYGYRLSSSFYNDSIFTNWFINWTTFSKKNDLVILQEEFNDYYLIKLDIKGFYDRIDLIRLKQKLYEEAPLNAKNKIDSLSELERTKYKNIVNYLIKLSSSTTGDSKLGLPQGPAYARYLAELYLIGLDQEIEGFILSQKSREFYNRFVDDVFIYVESYDRAQELLEKINNWMSINNLDLNTDKTEVCTVKEYRDSGKYKSYKDDNKYSINKANKNKEVLSESEIQKAISDLTNLTSDIKFGLKDNLRFFFNQFKTDKRLDVIKKKIAEIVPYSPDGRGSLYYMFYSELFDRDINSFWMIITKLEKVRGLSFTHYINTILLKSSDQKIDSKIIRDLIETVIAKKIILADADKLLILTLSLKYEIEMDERIMKETSKEIIYAVLETPEIDYSVAHYELIISKLKEITNYQKFVDELFRMIIQNKMSAELAKDLSNYIFTRFTEWDGKDGAEEAFQNDEYLVKLFNCLCFFSLFFDEEAHSKKEFSWKMLIKASSKHKLTVYDLEYAWYKKIESYTLDEFSKSRNSFLVSENDGSEFKNYNCNNGFLEKYKTILLFLIFDKKGTEEKDFNLAMDEIEKSESLFIKWLKDSDSTQFPMNKNICSRNIALNGLIVLTNEKRSKIFVKNLHEPLEGKFKAELSEVIGNEKEIEYSKTAFFNLRDKLKSDTLVELIIKVSDLTMNDYNFSVKYSVNLPYHYTPSLINGLMPLVPFYSIYPKIIDNNGVPKEVTINNYYDNILSIIKEFSDLNLVKVSDNKFSFKGDRFEDRFFPKVGVFLEHKIKLEFMQIFASFVKESASISIFDYQFAWSKSIFSVLLKDEKDPYYNLIQYLFTHFKSFNDEEYYLDILFAVNSSFKIEFKTITEFFGIIEESAVLFETLVNTNTKLLSDYYKDALNHFCKCLHAESNMVAESFSICKLQLNTITDVNNLGNKIVSLMVNERVIEGDVKLNLFYYSLGKFMSKTATELFNESNNKKLFGVLSDKIYYFVIVDDELNKCYERICNRFKIYSDLFKSGNTEDQKLFPISTHYKTAENNYITNATPSLDKILKGHYSQEYNIRNRVIQWLSVFNEESIKDSNFEKFLKDKKFDISKLYRAVLAILDKHIYIDNDDLDFFAKKIIEYKENTNVLFFPLKHPHRDLNGLSRLIDKCGVRDRTLDFEEDVRALFEEDCSNKKIVILTDCSISGTQFRKAYTYYMKKYKDNEEVEAAIKKSIENKEKYFDIKSLEVLELFRKNIATNNGIIFLSTIITEDAQKVITDTFKGNISFQQRRILKGDEYLVKGLDINHEYLETFSALINDIALVEKLFHIDDFGRYNTDVKDFLKNDIILRIGSLPKKHIKLFSLKTRFGNKSLLEFEKEWGDKKNDTAPSVELHF